MTYSFPSDLAHWVKARMATGRYACEDDLLREAKEALESQEHVLDDIRQGFEDLEAGRYRPLREIDAEFRKKHNIA